MSKRAPRYAALEKYLKTEVLYPATFKANGSYAAEIIKAFEYGYKAGRRSRAKRS